jgi:hypothetical protein
VLFFVLDRRLLSEKMEESRRKEKNRVLEFHCLREMMGK